MRREMSVKFNLKKYIMTLITGGIILILAGCANSYDISHTPVRQTNLSKSSVPENKSDGTDSSSNNVTSFSNDDTVIEVELNEHGVYDTKDEVAQYIWIYHRLPDNYMTKSAARDAGWKGGALHLVVEGMCIGGDRFGNYEGELPEKRSRNYYECDIDTLSSRDRGRKRIVYTDDGWNIYYTEDHYESFEHLYGDDEE
jgi:hypothetical protein